MLFPKMNHFRRVLFSLVACVALVASSAAEDRPNILIILVDDLGYSDLGFQGGEIETPHIDRLANDGLKFTQFYNCARCGPTRASIMTGLYSHQVGVYELEPVEPGNNMFLSELLGENGYATYMSGKWHLGNTPERLPPARGFHHSYAYQGCCGDYWQPPLYVLESPEVEPVHYGEGEFHATDATTDYAVKFLQHHEENEEDSPFFLYLAYQAPHSPIQAPKHLIDKYVERYEQGWDKIREDRWRAMKAKGWFEQYDSVPSFSDSPPWHDEHAQPTPIRKWKSLSKVEKADQTRRMATYAAMVDQVDQGVGKTLAQLEEMGELDNTLILFLSDNGANYEGGPNGNDGPLKGKKLANMGQPGTKHHVGSQWAALSNTPLRLYKHFNHEGGILTPFIAHWPNGIKRSGQEETQRGHVIDFMSTIVELAEIEYPETLAGNQILPMEGVSLVPAFRGEKIEDRALYFEHEANRALFKGDFKLVSKNFTSLDGQTHHDWELYNIAKDPLEQNDIASQHYYDMVIPLSREWHQWATRTDAIVGYEKWMLKLQYYWQTGLRTYLDDAF